MIKKSNYLLIILTIMFMMVLIDGVARFYVAQKAESYAATLNHLGYLRGSIQRIAKLETNNIRNDHLIQYIDLKVHQYTYDKTVVELDGLVFRTTFAKLHTMWDDFKVTLAIYRESPTAANQKVLLDKSEDIWLVSNSVILEAQLFSEMKFKQYRRLLLFSLVNLIFLFLITIFVKKYVHDKLEFLAIHDPLTKVYNRTYLGEFLKREIEVAARGNNPLAVIMLDIDYFKNINDAHGHDAGDTILKELVKTIIKILRKNDLLARYGGEEFTIVLPKTPLPKAMSVAERIRNAIALHNFKLVDKVTVSLGVTHYAAGDNEASLLKKADLALYHAKHEGRNCISQNEAISCQ